MNILAEHMTEKELDACCVEASKYLRLYTYHTFDSRRSEPGFPDRVFIGHGVLIRELKTEKGRLTAAQKDCIERLRHAGMDVAVWRPSDWYSKRIDEELQAIVCRHALEKKK